MIVKEAPPSPSLADARQFVSKKFKRYRIWILGGMVVLSLLVVGAFVVRRNYTELREIARQSYNRVQGMQVSAPMIKLDIKYKDYQKLQYFIKLANQAGYISPDQKEFVPAKIRFQGETFKANVRIKGLWIDHVSTPKFSLKVRLKGEGTLFGMKRFSLQHPKTRNYVTEWAYHAALRREGIMALRYQFVKVTINGKELGLYALEEGLEKRLIENNQSREGVIIGFDNSLANFPFSIPPYMPRFPIDIGIQSSKVAPIKVFNQKRVLNDPILLKQYRVAHSLLEKFRLGKLKTSEVFDANKLATYFAVSDLMGARGAPHDWHDLRFYYNPVTARLEPIAAEGSCVTIEKLVGGFRTGSENLDDYFHDRLFSDLSFYQKYSAVLERVSQKAYLDDLMTSIGPELKKRLALLYQEWPDYRSGTYILSSNAAFIRLSLNPRAGIRAYFGRDAKGKNALHLANIQSLPISVEKIKFGSGSWKKIPSNPVLFPVAKGGFPKFQRTELKLPRTLASNGSPSPKIQIKYRILGTQHIRKIKVTPLSYQKENTIPLALFPKGAVPNFPFVKVHKKEKIISIKKGKWTLRRDFVVPAGYRLSISAGTQLDLKNSSKLVSFSPVTLFGTKSKPIIIKSSDNSGQGMVVLNAKGQSKLRHVIFDGLREPKQGAWNLTGAVTFFESPVDIYRTKFLNNQSEDSLNIIRSNFHLERVLFRNTRSDALDVDFGKGIVIDSQFIKIGNDGVDISGSEVTLKGILISDAGDKGISIGEHSVLFGSDIDISYSPIGIAAKDLSTAIIDRIKIKNVARGIVVYRKKSEFGPATVDLDHATIQETPIPHAVEIGSSLKINRRTIAATHRNLYENLISVEPKSP